MSARVLLFLVVPGHLIFFYIIYLVEGHWVTNSTIFVVLYLLAGLIQVRDPIADHKWFQTTGHSLYLGEGHSRWV